MANDFNEELLKAVDEAVKKELAGVEHHMRQVFYKGVEFGMQLRRKAVSLETLEPPKCL